MTDLVNKYAEFISNQLKENDMSSKGFIHPGFTTPKPIKSNHKVTDTVTPKKSPSSHSSI